MINVMDYEAFAGRPMLFELFICDAGFGWDFLSRHFAGKDGGLLCHAMLYKWFICKAF